MKRVIALTLWAGMACPALAANPADCDPGADHLDQAACAEYDVQRADAELNAVYRQVLVRHADDPVAVARVRAAQRLWVQLRDADLDARYPVGKDEDPRVRYGSLYPLLYSGTKAVLTALRTEYLRSQFLERSQDDV